ncbi:MAG TPA: carboxypeptidase regulatory-like domain-containing protein [Verrucomicrobiae bacterium]|nr:carboxypeptidase regulatory-like domain-containing protein [Verrucomicrobiae bacterium]
MSNPDPIADGKTRLIVVVPVVLVCLGAIYLLLNLRKPVRESINSPAANTNISTSHTRTSASNQMVRRSTHYQFEQRLRTGSQKTQLVEAAIILDPQTETKAPAPSDRIVSGAAPAGAVVLLDSGIEVRGRVTLSGTAPPELTIDMTRDPRCAALHSKPVSTRHYVADKHGRLANVFVYVKTGLAEKSFPTPADAPLLDQVGCEYTPYMMGVQVNQKIRIKNSDPTLHNVHATPRPGTSNKEFNFAQPLKDMITEKSFPGPEVLVRFKCDVHPWMFAYVGVVEHPFFSVTDVNGEFKLPPGLRPGRYTLEAVHPKTGAVSQEIDVRAGEKTTVDFTLQVPSAP